MIIGEALPRNAQHFPNKLAIVDQTRSLTHLDLHLRTNRLGNYLVKQGIRRGDRVALSCGGRAEHFEMLFGLAKIGAIAVPFDYHWSADECAAMLEFSNPALLFWKSVRRPEISFPGATAHLPQQAVDDRLPQHGPEHPLRRSARCGSFR
jgi:acyl-CoA synthetase (AMP-forming)/AMP-acid ligase II